VFEPLHGTRPDWRIIQDLANLMGANWKYEHPSEIYDEIASLCPLYAGVNYKRLEGYKSLQWPVALDGTDQPLLYTQKFGLPDGKAKLFPVELRLPQDQPDSVFDLHLNNGRLLEHFHEGIMTYRTPGIREQVPDTFVEISPELAKERGVQSGSMVKLISRYGELETRALITTRVTGKELYMPVNSSETRVNLLTGAHADHETHTPAYKENSVRMEVLPQKVEQSPLPKNNHRFQKRTPQAGVEVERKWQKPKYQFPDGAPLPPGAHPNTHQTV
jgi:formate dehydrogenase major subunit